MNYIEHRFSLVVEKTVSQTAVKVKRGDTLNRLIINLTDHGYPYHISEEVRAFFVDGDVMNACTIDNCSIIYDLTTQTVGTVGRHQAEIRLVGHNDEVITTAKFTIIVENTIYDDNQNETVPQNNVDALTGLISEASQLIDEVNKSLENGDFNGAPGESAYETAVRNGFKGTEAEWLASLEADTDKVEALTARAETAANKAENAAKSVEDVTDNLKKYKVYTIDYNGSDQSINDALTSMFSETASFAVVIKDANYIIPAMAFIANRGISYIVGVLHDGSTSVNDFKYTIKITSARAITRTKEPYAVNGGGGGGGAVSSVNGKTGAVELTAKDVGALPDDTEIPEPVTDEQIATAVENYLAENPIEGGNSGIYVGSDTAPDGTKLQIDPAAGDTFTIPDVLQSTGNSEEDTMSQKAITEAIANRLGDGGAVSSVNGQTGDVKLTVLPNPKALTFTGAVESSYDGSTALEVNIPEGGGGGGAEKWELMALATMTEDAESVQLTLDAPCKKVRFVCFPNAAVSSWKKLTINGGSGLSTHNVSLKAGDALVYEIETTEIVPAEKTADGNPYFRARIRLTQDLWLQPQNGVVDGYDGSVWLRCFANAKEVKNSYWNSYVPIIMSVGMQTATMCVTGATFEVWGVRA